MRGQLLLSLFLSSSLALSWPCVLWIAIALPAVVAATKDPLAPALTVVDIAADGSSQDAVTTTCQGSSLHPLPQALHGFGVVRPKASRRYRRQALEDQQKLLEKHLRQAQEQLRNLKRQLPKRRVLEQLQNKQRTMTFLDKKLIKDQIQLLSNQVQTLEQMILDLNRNLQQRLMKIEELELAILDHDKQEHRRVLTQELDYPRRVRELELEIKESTDEQVAQMQKLYNDRIQYAKEMTERDALEDLETKVQQATAALRVDLQQALKVERQNRKDAVENQRAKQRLLAKALAIPETKYREIMVEQQQQREQDALLKEQMKHLEEVEATEQVDRQLQIQHEHEHEQVEVSEQEDQQQAKRTKVDLEEQLQEQPRVELLKKEQLEAEEQEVEQSLEEPQHRQEQQQQIILETNQEQKRQADELKSNLKEEQAEKERLIKDRQAQEWQVLEDENPEPQAESQDEKETVVLAQQHLEIVSTTNDTPFQRLLACVQDLFQQPRVNSPEPEPVPPESTQSKPEAPPSKPFEPAVYKFESFNRKVCWQPMTLPPPSVSKLSF